MLILSALSSTEGLMVLTPQVCMLLPYLNDDSGLGSEKDRMPEAQKSLGKVGTQGNLSCVSKNGSNKQLQENQTQSDGPDVAIFPELINYFNSKDLMTANCNSFVNQKAVLISSDSSPPLNI